MLRQLRRAPGHLLAALLLLSSACARTPSDSGTQETESTIVVAYSADMVGVNELLAQAVPIQTALMYYALFMPLLEEQADYHDGPPSFKPRLAESWEVAEGGKSITFALRQGVTWSDGTPVTAEDVRWTWQAQTSPEIAWPYAEIKEGITDVEVVDPRTVVFRFATADPTNLTNTIQGVILPRHAWSQLPFSEWRDNAQWFVDNLVVNGPFILDSWEPAQRFVLRRNPSYFDPDEPKVDRIVFDVTPDRGSQLAKLRSGEAHLIEWVQPADVATVEADPDLQLIGYHPRFSVFIAWNNLRPLFAEAEVRRALTHAIDRQAIIDTLCYGQVRLAVSPILSDVWAHHSGLEPLAYDPAEARRLLAGQGWKDSDGDGWLDRDGEVFRFELLTNSDNELRRDIQVMVKDQLREVGIDAQTRTVEFATLYQLEQSHEFDGAVTALSTDTSLNLRPTHHSSEIDNGFNWMAYSSPEADRLIEELEPQLSNVETALPLFHELQELLHRDQPVTFLYEPKIFVGASAALRDVDPNAISPFFHLRRWRLEDGG